MMSRAMHDRPGGPAPAVLPPASRSAAGTRPVAAGVAPNIPTPGILAPGILAPGLHAAFDGCLAEALPADLAALLGRLDRSGPVASRPSDSRKRS
jgi:hypothetical protein